MTDNLITRAGKTLYGEQWQPALARDLRVSRSAVEDWRQGRSRVRPAIYAEIAALLRTRAAAMLPVIDDLDTAAGGD